MKCSFIDGDLPSLFYQFHPSVLRLSVLRVVRCNRGKVGHTIGFQARCGYPVFVGQGFCHGVRAFFPPGFYCFSIMHKDISIAYPEIELLNASNFKGFIRIYFICIFIISESSERSVSEGLMRWTFRVSQVVRSVKSFKTADDIFTGESIPLAQASHRTDPWDR